MARSNRFKPNSRQGRHTTLIVVEGDVEKVFVEYLKSLCGSGCGTRVTVRNAFGGSGDAILEYALKLSNRSGYDVVACLSDADKPPSLKKNLQEANRRKIVQLQSRPCIEGFLLGVLGKKVPSNSGECKRQMAVITKGKKLNDPNMLQSLFPLAMLEEIKNEIPVLKRLFRLIRHK